jgi:RND family efflux transporter MFP subunit
MSRPVDLGDSFQTGDLLARIDSRQFDHAVAGARARLTELDVRLAQAARQRARTIRLMEKNAATLEEMEHVDAEVDALKAASQAAGSALQETERAAAETTIVASFDGIVSQVFMEPGEFASPGQPVLKLSGTGEVEIRVEVPEGMLEWVVAGREVPVWFPGIHRKRTGTVRSVGRATTGQGQLFPVVIALPSTDWLIPGLSAEVEVDNPAPQGLLVPLAAIRKSGDGGTTVWRVQSGQVEQVPVALAGFSGDQVVVVGKLAAGDQVLIEHPHGLVDGTDVEVRR